MFAADSLSRRGGHIDGCFFLVWERGRVRWLLVDGSPGVEQRSFCTTQRRNAVIKRTRISAVGFTFARGKWAYEGAWPAGRQCDWELSPVAPIFTGIFWVACLVSCLVLVPSGPFVACPIFAPTSRTITFDEDETYRCPIFARPSLSEREAEGAASSRCCASSVSEYAQPNPRTSSDPQANRFRARRFPCHAFIRT